jgi:ubiquinone/menaquinone biosynthesis C-methylase UbiE
LPNERLSREQADEIRAMKRAYWAQDGIGKHYQYFAHMPDGVTRAKNVTEIRFVCRHVVGPRVLDAGAGTGRFTLPLQRTGINVVAADLSLEMLREGARRAAMTDAPFAAVSGDIERLPFGDGAFDSLVSMTVLRHFPSWREILAEYVRVVRDGGRLVFDVGSGEQRAYMKQAGWSEKGEYDPLGYDVALTLKELERVATEYGLSVVTAVAHDFFNENALLIRLLGDEWERFEEALNAALKEEAAVALYDVLARRFLTASSPAVTSHLLVVLKKGETRSGETPPCRQGNEVPAMGSPEDQLSGLMQAILGLRFNSHVREVQRALEAPEAKELFEFCRKEIVPRFPLEAICWEAE